MYPITVSHVKWRGDDALFGAFAVFDRVVQWLVKVFHASESPARRRLTWEMLTDCIL